MTMRKCKIFYFDVKIIRCTDTHEPLKEKVICYHCGKAFSKEVTNYQARMDEYGYEVGREYITDILMREEEHILDRIFKEINLPDKIDQAIKWMTAKMAKMPDPDPADSRYVPAADGYPQHRRASRLSFAIWTVIGLQGGGQDVLDAPTTADRLLLASNRINALIASLRASPA